MRIRRHYLRLVFLMLSIVSFTLSARAVVKEHQDIANYVFDLAKTRLQLQAAAVGIMTPAFIEEKVNDALARDDIALVKSYREVAAERGYAWSEETEARYQEGAEGPAA